jgi:hypothetical protein
VPLQHQRKRQKLLHTPKSCLSSITHAAHAALKSAAGRLLFTPIHQQLLLLLLLLLHSTAAVHTSVLYHTCKTSS